MCGPNAKKLCDDDGCQICFKRSFANHPQSTHWSPKNAIRSRNAFLCSNKKFLFDCNVCRHTFETSLNSIVGAGSRCPYCTGKKLCEDDECAMCFDRSFASHPRSEYWSKKNVTSSRHVFLNSAKKILFDCNVCKHTFENTPHNITSFDRWCSYCTLTNGKLCDDIDCAMCFDRSFASHKKSKYWSSKNVESPRTVFLNSHKKFSFVCKNGHEFESTLYHISEYGGCVFCANKTEAKLLDEFVNLGYDIKTQAYFDWCKNEDTNRKLPFDFVIESYRVIIELDGRQHFRQVSNWIAPDEQQKRDLYKMNYANANGYTVIRVLQEDVWNDRNNWMEKIEEHLYVHEVPTRIYISSGDEYKCFM